MATPTPAESVSDWTTVYAYTNSDPLCKCTPVYTGQLWESKGKLSFVGPKGVVTQWHGEVDYEGNGHLVLSVSFTGDEKILRQLGFSRLTTTVLMKAGTILANSLN